VFDLHVREEDASQFSQNHRLGVGLGHYRATRLVQLRLDIGDLGLDDTGLLSRRQFGGRRMELLTEVATVLTLHVGATIGPHPRTLTLETIDLALNAERGAMLRDPPELVLGTLQASTQILIGLRMHGPLTGRIKPVEHRMTERRRERVGRNNDPDHGGSGRLGPHLVFYCGKKEERNKRLEAIGRGTCSSVDLAVQLGSAEAESEPPVHCSGHSEQNTCRQYAEHAQCVSHRYALSIADGPVFIYAKRFPGTLSSVMRG